MAIFQCFTVNFIGGFFNFSVPRFLAKVLIDFFINNLGFCSFTLNLQKNENMDLNIFFFMSAMILPIDLTNLYGPDGNELG